MSRNELIKIALSFNPYEIKDIDYIFMSQHGYIFFVTKNGLDAYVHSDPRLTKGTILILSEELIEYERVRG